MAIVLKIAVVEADDAKSFQIYDQTIWSPAFDYTKATSVILSVLYNGETYTHDITTALGMTGSFINLCGPAGASYYTVLPTDLLYLGTALGTTHFPDGYYEITISLTYNASPYTDTSYQGFLSESYLMASSLPLDIDITNFDYEENRLQFLCITLFQSAKYAAELGRAIEFGTIVTKLNSFLSARSINDVWAS
jgi:hypothetical protein